MTCENFARPSIVAPVEKYFPDEMHLRAAHLALLRDRSAKESPTMELGRVALTMLFPAILIIVFAARVANNSFVGSRSRAIRVLDDEDEALSCASLTWCRSREQGKGARNDFGNLASRKPTEGHRPSHDARALRR